MRKIFLSLAAALMLVLGFGSAASADKAAEFDVTTEGITLHEGVTFGNNHNIHFDYFDSDGYLHKDRGTTYTGPEGESFVSWADLGLTDGDRIVYVHVTGHGKWNLGKGIPVGPKPDSEIEKKSETEVRTETEFVCPDEEATYGLVVVSENTYRLDFERSTTVTWNGTDWVETWGDWVKTGEERTSSVEVSTRMMTDEELREQGCGLPATGAPLVMAGIAAGLLTLAGGGLMLARRHTGASAA